MLSYRVVVVNDSDTTSIYQLRGEDFTGPLIKAREVEAGSFSRTDRHHGKWTPPAEGQADDKRRFEKWCQESVTITFTMNGKRWTRTGSGKPKVVIEGTDAAVTA